MLLFLSIFPFVLSCGGGGGGGNGGGSQSATITGTVAGTVVVAINENNNEVARVTATGAGSPKSFTLTVPVGGAYRFYLIEDEGTADEEVFFIYQDTTNVFNISSAVTVDLGFVDTSSGVAVPANNPLNISGVTSGGQNTSLPPGVNDNTTPVTPTGLSATAVSSSQIDLSWTASKDNVGVSGYKIYRDGAYLKSITTTSTSDTGLSPETQYCYTVSAYDAAGNESGQSSQACATTSQGPTCYNIAEYLPLAQGDTWSYRDTVDGDLETDIISGTENINGVDAAKKIDEDGDYQLWTNSNGITFYKKYDADDLDEDCGEGHGWSQSVFTPPITATPAEVCIGAKYTSTFTSYYTNCRGESKTATSSMEFTIEGIEDVTVTAGTFKDCLKGKTKSSNMFSDEGQIGSGESTIWLAKGVGVVKSIDESGHPQDLLSATVGGVHYGQ
ncbi:MAG: fibronectin type III domain-containing protein [Nitrospirota bacterium]